MDSKPIKFRRAEGRKPIGDESDPSLAEEGFRIRQADEKDGTNPFLEAAFGDAMAEEPEYPW